jgi:hypothetical protein
MLLVDRIRRTTKDAFSMRVLVIKSFILSLSWFFLPFWAFFVVSFYFYLVPFFRPFKLLVPFILTLATAFIVPHSPWFGVFLAILFFLLLGIKNLIFINRFDNHQLVVFLILFLIFFGFFRHFEDWQKSIISLASLGLGLSFFFLFNELADYSKESGKKSKIFISGLGSFLLWQVAMAVLFLPLNYFYQTAILFLFSVILTDILLEYFGGKIGKRKILWDFSIFFVIAVIVLASANWEL